MGTQSRHVEEGLSGPVSGRTLWGGCFLLARVRRFRKKKFSLQSETKRNEIRFACVSHADVKFFFSLLFASNFLLPIKAKLIERIFALFRFQKLYVLLLGNVFLLCFASKRNKINVFSLLFTILGNNMKKSKTSLNIFLRFFTNCPRISLYPFLLWCFRFFFVLFSLHFIFRIEAKKISLPFRFKAKIMAVFSFRFASFRFEAKGLQFFASVSLHFALKRK